MQFWGLTFKSLLPPACVCMFPLTCGDFLELSRPTLCHNPITCTLGSVFKRECECERLFVYACPAIGCQPVRVYPSSRPKSPRIGSSSPVTQTRTSAGYRKQTDGFDLQLQCICVHLEFLVLSKCHALHRELVWIFWQTKVQVHALPTIAFR